LLPPAITSPAPKQSVLPAMLQPDKKEACFLIRILKAIDGKLSQIFKGLVSVFILYFSIQKSTASFYAYHPDIRILPTR
jgi:hypothetical protein